MDPFHINIPEHEFTVVEMFIVAHPEEMSVMNMARGLKMNENHLRYILDELVVKNRITKIAIDDRHKHKRYRYEVIK